MTITSYPFDSQSITETDYSRLFREFQSTGVADTVGGSAFYAYADGTGMTVKVSPGFAIIRGHAVYSTATESLTITASASSARIDRVVLRLDPAANSITLAVLTGTAGSGVAPTLTQTDTGTYEFPLATVAVGANVTSISAASMTAERKFIGSTVGGWTTTTRPTSPRVGRLGLNLTTNVWEYWDGTAWKDMAPAVSWSTVTGKPTTFAPATHTHLWADITDKPSTFTPAAHTTDWSTIVNEPTTYPPSTHSHTWSSITSKPSTFTPASHTHSSYLESGDTISWANGSKKPYSNTATDGTWYAVWVEGSGTFCRNTSARKFKENIQDFEINPDDVLKMRPVIYDRKDQVDEETGELRPGRKGEVGLIADEVDEIGLKWLVQYMDGEIDALRYDLLGVALLPVVQRQAQQLADLEGRLAVLEAAKS
ncbi:tail fiber domain-containing protein [Streptomyces prunicolor]|uniref:tail fiber domain-containing protein n=1 Tax=Streptomyces prunicolor TaxID=67348 RepID=UPI002257D0DF|nr:tail fiber domain-containing protein [Streptomyces prunicolor]MCX5236245.1 tail fiber domain-containing protein [Streptomyces prunicolor]